MQCFREIMGLFKTSKIKYYYIPTRCDGKEPRKSKMKKKQSEEIINKDIRDLFKLKNSHKTNRKNIQN